ncbi:MAG: hypothetical protein BRD48_03650 [Bacteroidetes bacterium QS_9_68_14]|nr:MAG: hypothetical protein BRD48_03650 [Bacteroidetes bacterium QS_9_68_14]
MAPSTGYTADAGADLIVTSSHGRTGPRGFLAGRVAERVGQHAPRRARPSSSGHWVGPCGRT